MNTLLNMKKKGFDNMEKELYEIFEPCSDDEAHSAEPKDEISLDMAKLEENLTERYEVVFSAEIMLLVSDTKYGVDIAFYPSGKILWKTDDTELVEKTYEDTVELSKKGLVDE